MKDDMTPEQSEEDLEGSPLRALACCLVAIAACVAGSIVFGVGFVLGTIFGCACVAILVCWSLGEVAR